jgi:hypothetical protein
MIETKKKVIDITRETKENQDKFVMVEIEIINGDDTQHLFLPEQVARLLGVGKILPPEDTTPPK